MVIGIIGENCSGKSTLAEEVRKAVGGEIVTGRDYLRMFVAMADTENLTKRFMDLCELNVRKWTERDGFRLDFCFDRWVVTAYLQSEFGYQYTIKRQYDLE